MVAHALISDVYDEFGGGLKSLEALRNYFDYAFREWERTPQFVDTGDRLGLNFGFVTHIDRWDFGFVTSYFDHPDLKTGLVDVNNDDIADSFPGEYRASTYETVLSFNYRF